VAAHFAAATGVVGPDGVERVAMPDTWVRAGKRRALEAVAHTGVDGLLPTLTYWAAKDRGAQLEIVHGHPEPEIGSVAELNRIAAEFNIDPELLLTLPCARGARDEILAGVTSRTYAEVLRAAAASAANPEKVRAIAEQLIAADAADHAEVDYDGEPF